MYYFTLSETVTFDESVHKDLTIKQKKISALVLDVQEIAESANINIDKIKQIPVLSYPFHKFKEEIRKAQDLTNSYC